MNIFSQDKILSHIHKIGNWLIGDPNTLVTVELDMTNKCNSKCPKCSGGRNNESSLTKDQAFSIVKQLSDFGIKGLTITGGGDPSLNPHSSDVIKYAYNLGLDVGFITNGLEWSDDLINSIVKYCTWCRISLDAGSEEVYKKVHGLGEGDFHEVLSNIKTLVNLKKKLKTKCIIGTGFLTGKDTIKDMFIFTCVSRALGVDYVQFRPFHYCTTPIDEELKLAKTRETKNFKVLCLKYKYEHFNEKRPYNKCYACNFITTITANYEVVACCHLKGINKFILGDLNKNSFEEIWNSKRKKDVFNNINLKNCPPLCRGDILNRSLCRIKQPQIHENFL